MLKPLPIVAPLLALAGCASRPPADLRPPLPEWSGRETGFRTLIAPTAKQKACQHDLDSYCAKGLADDIVLEFAPLGATKSDILYHNDAPASLSRSVATRLPKLFHSLRLSRCLEQPETQPALENAWTFTPGSLRYQRTLGEDSTLFVMTRDIQPLCKPRVFAYPLSRSDRLYVYYGPDDLSPPEPDFESRIADPDNPPAPDQRIFKTGSVCMETPDCQAPGRDQPAAATRLYWALENRRPLVPQVPAKEVGPLDVLETPAAQVLRRIVVRHASGQREMIRIDTPCAAFKLCHRNPGKEGCGDEIMCLLRPEYTVANRNCRNCAIDATPGPW